MKNAVALINIEKKEYKPIITDIVISQRFIKEFARLIMIGTQEADEYNKQNWTRKEKQAFEFAKKLIKIYA